MIQSKRLVIKEKIEKRIAEIEGRILKYLGRERIQMIKDETKSTFLNIQSLYEFETSLPKPTTFENSEISNSENIQNFNSPKIDKI